MRTKDAGKTWATPSGLEKLQHPHGSAGFFQDRSTLEKGTLPSALDWGPNSVATISDGSHTIFVGSMWATGLWRYVEP